MKRHHHLLSALLMGTCAALLLPAAAGAAPRVKQLTFSRAEVTRSMRYPGKRVGGLRWQDRAGHNVLVFSQIRTTRNRGGDLDPMHSVKLYARHYIQRGRKARLARKVRDYGRRCEFDLTAEVIKASLSVTDLDGDGLGEATFAYKIGCRSDVSPIRLKLLVLEKGKKYILRGNTRVKVSADESMGGDYRVDRSFKRGPASFLRHARAVWRRVVREF